MNGFSGGNILKKTVQTCYHCGEQCDEKDLLFYDSQVFCCNGCQTVYQILSENELTNYYQLEENPGLSPRHSRYNHKYEFLDDDALRDSLLEFSDGGISKVVFLVPQIHCTSCIWLLENLHRLDEGVRSCRVDFLKRTATIVFEQDKISLKKLVLLLAGLGYEPAITMAEGDHQKTTKRNFRIYYQLGIAGFAFGNIMLFSLPEYFGLEGEFISHFAELFAYLNIVISLPVLLYSDQDYFKSAYLGLKQKTVNLDVPICLGIIALYGVSLYEIFSQTGPGYLDTFAGLIFFLLTGKAFQQKTYEKLSFERDYKSYFPISVTVIDKHKKEVSKPVKNLTQGERILVRNQELIPADSILLQGRALVDYSFVTGEAAPLEKVNGEIIYAGGRQMGESIELEVVKEVSQSYLTSLWNNEVFSKHQENAITLMVNKNSKYFTAIIVTIATLAGLYWLSVSGLGTGVKVFSSVLIVACPCALALSTPFTLGHTIRVLGRNHFYLKNATVIEALANADTIVFDKTGTLTDTSSTSTYFKGKDLSVEENLYIKSVLRNSTHPLSRRLFESMEGDVLEVSGFYEYTGKGVEGKVAGKTVKLGSAAFVTDDTNTYREQQTSVYVSIDGNLLGYYIFENHFRDGIAAIMSGLKKFRFYVLSGDNPKEKDRIQSLMGSSTSLFFNQSPADKLHFVDKLQGEQKSVIMVGDGLNDAGALKKSNVGIAITDNVSNFSPACDVIMDASVFHKLDQFIGFAGTGVKVIKSCFLISFLYNVVGLTVTVSGHLSPLFAAIVMPLSSITIVLYTTLVVNWLAKRQGL